jgi:pyridoxal 5'-phosphate synthase pdxT subunit
MELSTADQFADLCVGVLELHGDFAEHSAMLQRCGVDNVVSVRQVTHLTDDLDALVLPGGESTVMGKLLCDLGMMERLRSLAGKGLPIFGTCAGCILLARDLPKYPNQPRIGAMAISVDRNAYGSQIDSFETHVHGTGKAFADGTPLRVVQIRAPVITGIADGVRVLAERGGTPILVRQDNLLACTFHPELTNDTRIHRMFLEMAHQCKAVKSHSKAVETCVLSKLESKITQ